MRHNTATGGSRRASPENYYVSLNDMLVGVLFIFILLLTTYALNFKAREDRMSALYKARLVQRAGLVAGLRKDLGLPERPDEAEEGILRFDESLLFARSGAVLKPEGQRLLRRLGERMEKVLPCHVSNTAPLPCVAPKAILEAVYVEGHTDSAPFAGGARDNWVLSSERAIAAYRALIGSASGVGGKHPLETLRNARGKENLIGISGYADRRKIDYKQDGPNRRVDLRFVLAAPSNDEQSASARRR